jgi:hypothetical protein
MAKLIQTAQRVVNSLRLNKRTTGPVRERKAGWAQARPAVPFRYDFSMRVKKSLILFLGLIGAGILASPAMAAPHDTTGHTPSAAAGGDPASKFDQKAALAISQARSANLGDYTLTAADAATCGCPSFAASRW